MANGDAPEKIVIDLDQATDVFELGDIQLQLQYRAYAAIKQRIEEQRDSARQIAENVGSGRDGSSSWFRRSRHIFAQNHSALAIVGSRGSGKTTFLRNLFKAVDEGRIPRVATLPIIDPTLVEDKENVLVSVISMIMRLAEEARDKKSLSSRQDQDKYDLLVKRLSDLADGLQVLDRVGKDTLFESWDHSEYVLEQGLARAQSGANLAECVADFVAAALQFVNKDAVLVGFDDIDTRIDKGWLIIETIRKYMSCPGLVVVVAGDFEMYGKTVRRGHFESFGELLLKYDRPSSAFHDLDSINSWHSDGIIRLVDHLEDQYIQKIFKASNRVRIETVSEILDRGSSWRHAIEPMISVRARILDRSEKQSLPIQADLKSIVGNLLEHGANASNQLDIVNFQRRVLQLPLRTILQFLRVWQKYARLNTDESEKIAASDVDIEEHRAEFISLSEEHDQASDVAMIFVSSIYRSELDFNEICSGDYGKLLRQICKFASVVDFTQSTTLLDPDLDTHDHGFCALVLLFQMARACESGRLHCIAMFLQFFCLLSITIGQDMNHRELLRCNMGLAEMLIRVLAEQGKLPSNRFVGIIPVSEGRIAIEKIAHYFMIKDRYETANQYINLLRQRCEKNLPAESIMNIWTKFVLTSELDENLSLQTLNIFNDVETATYLAPLGKILRTIAIRFTSGKLNGQVTFSVMKLLDSVRLLTERASNDPRTDYKKIAREYLMSMSVVSSFRAFEFNSRIDYAGVLSESEDAENSERSSEGDLIEGADSYLAVPASEDTIFADLLGIWLGSAVHLPINACPVGLERKSRMIYEQLAKFSMPSSQNERFVGQIFFQHILCVASAILLDEAMDMHRSESFEENVQIDSKSPMLIIESILKHEITRKAKSDGTLDSTDVVITEFPIFTMFFSCPLVLIFTNPEQQISIGGTQRRLFEFQIELCRSLNLDENYSFDLEEHKHAMRFNHQKTPYENLWALMNSIPSKHL